MLNVRANFIKQELDYTVDHKILLSFNALISLYEVWFVSKIWKKVRGVVGKIGIVDRFLLIFMVALFVYIIYHLFTGVNDAQNTSTIDVIVRTSIAGIFGYFLSSNFVRTDSSTLSQSTDNPDINLTSKPADNISNHRMKNQIGFQDSTTPSNQVLGGISLSDNSPTPIRSYGKVQIMVVSIIGLISLVILFLSRSFQNTSSEFTATISQLRDLVSGSIGFLISYGKNTTS